MEGLLEDGSAWMLVRRGQRGSTAYRSPFYASKPAPGTLVIRDQSRVHNGYVSMYEGPVVALPEDVADADVPRLVRSIAQRFGSTPRCDLELRWTLDMVPPHPPPQHPVNHELAAETGSPPSGN